MRAPHIHSWINDGRGNFKLAQQLTCDGEVDKGFLADINGDSRLDAVSCSGRGLCVFLLQENGEFIPDPVVQRDRKVWQAAAVDLNDDKALDLIYVDQQTRETFVAINLSHG